MSCRFPIFKIIIDLGINVDGGSQAAVRHDKCPIFLHPWLAAATGSRPEKLTHRPARAAAG